MRTSVVLTSLVGAAVAATAMAPLTRAGDAPRLRAAAVERAVDEALDGLEWVVMDMHLHTDHSSDGGLFHQQEKDQHNQDTFLDEQRDQAMRMGVDAIAFTDHRNYGQHYDPGYVVASDNPLADGQFLVTGEEWGGGRHATAFAIVNRIDHGPTELLGCGLAQMTLEVAAQDGLLGMAHPKDGGADACMADLVDFPLSHVEALRGGDNLLQEEHGFPGGGNGSNAAWYQAFVEAGGRAGAVNGSDNHFKQVWPGPSGPGGSTAFVLVEADAADPEAAFVEGVRARRTLGGWGAANARIALLLDADQDGTFETLMGGAGEPTGDEVTVAVRVTGVTDGVSTGHTVQILDEAGVVVAEEPITAPVQTMSWSLPASSSSYRAMVSTVAATQVGLPDPLDYVDTRILSSSPVWTTPDVPRGTDPAGADVTRLGGGDFSGFGDITDAGDGVLHAVWVERHGAARSLWVARSIDGGATWGTPVPVEAATAGARTPTVAASGDTVVLAWEVHDPTRYGGAIRTLVSTDGGVTWAPGGMTGLNVARPDLAVDGDVAHLVFQEQQGDGTWAIVHQTLRDGRLEGDATVLSTAVPTHDGWTNVAVPPRELVHLPASVEPVVTAADGVVVVAWEDNRDDPTPGRSGSPDDWAIFGTVSVDGGATFAPDVRWTENPRRKDDPADPEGVEGNPALDADLVLLADGGVLLAFTQTDGSGYPDVWTRAGSAGADGVAWQDAVRVTTSRTWSYQPKLRVRGAEVDVVWQEGSERDWQLLSSTAPLAADGWRAPTALTSATRYAGWHELAGDHVVFTAETAGGVFATHTARLPVG